MAYSGCTSSALGNYQQVKEFTKEIYFMTGVVPPAGTQYLEDDDHIFSYIKRKAHKRSIIIRIDVLHDTVSPRLVESAAAAAAGAKQEIFFFLLFSCALVEAQKLSFLSNDCIYCCFRITCSRRITLTVTCSR